MAVSGYLQIKTRINNDEVDKGVKQLEDKIKKLQTDNSRNSQEQSNLEDEIASYEKLQQEADSYRQKLKELNIQKQEIQKQNPSMAVGQDSAELANIKAQITAINQEYSKAVTEIDKQAPKINNVYSKLDKVKAKQTENNTKISEYKQKIESIKTQHIENSVNNVGKGISKQISQIGRMAMGIVGIRTAWGAVRSVISLVSQYDKQTATNLEYMRYVLANAIMPVVQNLVSLAMTLLSYINAITSAWFGINLFGNSSVKNFQKMKNSASGTAKAVKEIKKSLAGFDEMNILQDNSGGTTAGGVSPSMDLSSMQAEIPPWLKWIIDNKDLVLAIIAGITAALISMKVLGLDPLLNLGIGVLVAGIVKLIQDVIGYLNDPSWENFGKIVSDIGLILLGLAAIIGSVPLAVAGAITLIVRSDYFELGKYKRISSKRNRLVDFKN